MGQRASDTRGITFEDVRVPCKVCFFDRPSKNILNKCQNIIMKVKLCRKVNFLVFF